jgi:hypothetical protein
VSPAPVPAPGTHAGRTVEALVPGHEPITVSPVTPIDPDQRGVKFPGTGRGTRVRQGAATARNRTTGLAVFQS